MAYYYDRNGHIQNYLRTARERNRDTRSATRKLLFIKHLTEIRVVVFATLKMLNMLTHKQLRGARQRQISSILSMRILSFSCSAVGRASNGMISAWMNLALSVFGPGA